MRFVKVKVLEKRRKKLNYLEGKLDEFIALGVPYARIEFEEDEYVNNGSCAGAYRVAIKRYNKEDVIFCKSINRKVYLINLKLTSKEDIKDGV